MRFGWPVRATAAVLLAAAVCALAVGRPALRGPDSAALFGVASLFILALGAGVVEVLGVAHRLVPGGIERVAPGRRRTTIRWSEVASLEWYERTRWYEVRGDDGEVIRIYAQLTALASFAVAALEGVPAHVLEARPGVRARLEILASGRQPPDNPDPEPWHGA